jgi:hypothetical protein
MQNIQSASELWLRRAQRRYFRTARQLEVNENTQRGIGHRRQIGRVWGSGDCGEMSPREQRPA